VEHDEYLRRMAELEGIGLASEGIPPPVPGVGFIPDQGSEWRIVKVEQEGSPDQIWYVHNLGLQMLEDEEGFDEGIEAIHEVRAGGSGVARSSNLRVGLSMTVFLPLMLILFVFRMPSHPGSLHTLGQVILGFGATLAIVGALVGIFTQMWWLVAVSVYWWVGAKVIESAAFDRGMHSR